MIVLKAPQEKLLDALQSVAGIVERRHTLPILANVLMRKTGAQIELTTSDLEIQVRTTRRARRRRRQLRHHRRRAQADRHPARAAGRPGRDARPPARTSSRCRAARAASRCRRCRPTTSRWCRRRPTSARPSACRRRRCKGLINQVHFAMAVHDIRYYLNGILFVAEGKTLTLVATDGHRLALAQATLEAEIPQAGSHPAAQDRARTAAPADGRRRRAIEMRFAGNQAKFSFGGMEFVTKLVEGKFPDYNRVIPKNHKNTVTLGRAPLLASLQRAAILTSEKFKGVRLNIEPGLLRIAVQQRRAGRGQGRARDRLRRRRHRDRLQRHLPDRRAGQHEPGDGQARAAGRATPARCSPCPSSAGFKYVVMPMRI